MRFSLAGYFGFAVLLGLQASRHSLTPERITEPWVELRLTVDRRGVDCSIFDSQREDPRARLTIRNLSPIPLWFLAPQDESDSGWLNPAIGWAHADGTPAYPSVRCCFGEHIGAQNYFALAPGASRELSVRMPLKPGENRLRVVYDISSDRGEEDPGTGLDRTLTPIRATSNLVSVTMGNDSPASDSGPVARR